MNDIEAIKQRLDIVDVARDYLTLKQSGAHFKSTCPFHHEKTPSFMINRERQIWHCFGCNEGGDIFSFVQRMENLDFRETLRLLAEKAGYELTTGQRAEINKNERVRLLELLQTAANVYHRIFLDVAGAVSARAYIERRGVAPEVIKTFQIGFAPSGWDILTKYLLKKGFAIEDCVKAGITIAKQDERPGGQARFFDRFRARIMFPIWDTHGRVIGFTGRLLFEDKNAGGKYVNTPETPLFHKSNVVYAIHLAKNAIKENGFTVLVEGQMDVVACHQIEMKNVVACSGTALTLEQLRLLKRFGEEIRMAFDADSAGQNAAERSIQLALAEGLIVKIIQIPTGAGKDADECIKKDVAVWRAAVAAAKPFMEHLCDKLVPEDQRTAILKDPRSKHNLSQKIAGFIALLPSAIERDHWIQKISLTLQVAPDILAEVVRRVRTQQPAAAEPAEEKNEIPKFRILMEERFMALLQEEFSLLVEVQNLLPSAAIIDPTYQTLYTKWLEQYTGDISLSSAPLKDPTLELLLSAAYNELGQKERQEELRSLVKRLREIYLNEQRANLIREIQRAEEARDELRLKNLLQQYQQFIV